MVDHYHLTLDQIANLTDRTISEVYFHARTKEGYIQVPALLDTQEQEEEVQTLETVIRDLSLLFANGMITKDNFDDCVRQAKVKFQSSEATNG